MKLEPQVKMALMVRLVLLVELVLQERQEMMVPMAPLVYLVLMARRETLAVQDSQDGMGYKVSLVCQDKMDNPELMDSGVRMDNQD